MVTKRINLTFKEEQYKKIQEKAESESLKPTTYIYRMVLQSLKGETKPGHP